MVDFKSTRYYFKSKKGEAKMAWELWDPFEDMKNLHKEMDKAFRDFYNRPLKVEDKKLVRAPIADISETKDEVTAKIELPGIEKKEIELKITENMLSVKAEKKQEIKQEKEGYFKHERSYQSFQRAFSLPNKVIAEKAEAKLENGLLEVKIPKEKPAIEKKTAAKRITIR